MDHGRTARNAAALLACAVALTACGATATGHPLAEPARPPTSAAMATAPTPATPPPWYIPAGTLVVNPATGRKESVDPAIARSAVLVGDSQSGGAAGVHAADTWVETGLARRGYAVHFAGAGGTGFVAGATYAANYPDAVESGKTVLPYGNPALVVIQGGGNDASMGATDEQITANAARLLGDLKASYPTSRFLLIGTLARGSAHGGGRRSQVDSLLAAFAKRNGLPFISAGDWLTRYDLTDQMADHVHLTRAGHKVLAGVLAGKLKAMDLGIPPAR